MTRPTRLAAAALAAAALLAAAGPARAEPYQDKVHHFTVDVPDGWEVIPPAEFPEVTAALGKSLPDMDLTFVAGFRPTGVKAGELPIVLVHVHSSLTDRVPFEEFEREFGRTLEAARDRDRKAGLPLWTNTTPPAYDRERKRVTFTSSLNTAQARVGGYTVGCVGPSGTIVLTGYSGVQHYRDRMPAFVQFGDSVQFDEAPGASLGALDRLFGSQLGDTGRMAVIGGVTVVLIFVIGFVVFREKPARSRLGF